MHAYNSSVTRSFAFSLFSLYYHPHLYSRDRYKPCARYFDAISIVFALLESLSTRLMRLVQTLLPQYGILVTIGLTIYLTVVLGITRLITLVA